MLGDSSGNIKMPLDVLNKTCKERSTTKKSEHHHRILHIQNSAGTKFQLKMKSSDQIN